MKKKMVKVTSAYERFVHWMLAISCLLLCYTGLGMMYKELNVLGVLFGGLKGLATVHDIMAVVFAVSLVLAILMWWKEAGVFVFPEDWEWIKAAGGYLWHLDHVPETGKYNPGQKAFFLTVAIFGLLMVCTGFFMWYPEKFPFGANLMDWIYVLHVLGFVVIFAFFFVHLYLGTIGNPGSVSAMISGKMELPVLRMLHPKWVKELEHEGKLIVTEEEK
ncbi:MAG TPA: formate dehydrogenase subunit gamma [Smithella sp.]|nr:formate dehydrogenase subunit gamma [Smithella sp.]HRS96745.1 formate dehydrogenase subunit gamma [Smithella sp.]